MKSFIFYAITLFFVLGHTLADTHAQGSQKAKITGQLIDGENQEALPFATVVLLKATDSSQVTFATADESGKFTLLAPKGKEYLLKADFLSYHPLFRRIDLTDNAGEIQIGKLGLRPDSEVLDAVEIVAKEEMMIVEADKRIFNVGADLTSVGGSLADVMDNIPSVTVDAEGNISLRGNGNVRILINGKPSGMTRNAANFIQQLPSDLVEKIEVITNPSAKYDAEGTGGIINIVMKKNQKGGWNGSVDVGAAWPHRYNLSLNLNYRTGKINGFFGYGTRYRDIPGYGISDRRTFFADSTEILDQDENWRRTGLSHNVRGGFDFYPAENTTITASATVDVGEDLNFGEVDYLYFLPSGQMHMSSFRETEETEEELDIDYQINFEQKFKRKGQKLTADVIYSLGQEKEAMDAEQVFNNFGEVPDLFQDINNEEFNRMWTFQADYVHPLGKPEEGKARGRGRRDAKRLETGFRGSFRNIGNDYKVDELNTETGDWERLENVSNEFDYQEDILAYYAMAQSSFGRLKYQLGLRAEYTRLRTELINTGETNDRDFLNLFPTAHFTYALSKEHSWQLSYSRRVRRPRFWELNPFYTFQNPLNFRSGNPNLNPEFTHSMETGYLFFGENMTLTTSLFYRHTTGVIQRISEVQEDGVTLTMPQNLATQDDSGLEIALTLNPTDWFQLNASSNIFYGVISSDNPELDNLEAEFFTVNGRGNARFTLNSKTNAQLTGFYRAPRNIAQGRVKAFYGLDFALTRDILKDKGNISFRVRDIFNSRKWRSSVEDETFTIVSERQWRPRQFILGFSYRINQDKNSRQRRGGSRGGGGGDDMM